MAVKLDAIPLRHSHNQGVSLPERSSKPIEFPSRIRTVDLHFMNLGSGPELQVGHDVLAFTLKTETRNERGEITRKNTYLFGRLENGGWKGENCREKYNFEISSDDAQNLFVQVGDQFEMGKYGRTSTVVQLTATMADYPKEKRSKRVEAPKWWEGQ